MTRRVRIPGIVDMVRVDEPAHVAAVSEDTRLDRGLPGRGPLVNRFIARRVRRTLQVGGEPLPSVAPREHPHRAERQAALGEKLDEALASGPPAPEHLDRFAAYVRCETGDDAIGLVAQEAIGRLFVSDYRSSAETWRAACLLDAAPRNMNPFRALGWALTGAVPRARGVLAWAIRHDPAGVHATGIAVHTLVRSLSAMRDLWRDEDARKRLSAEDAVRRSLRAPETVLRQCSAAAVTAVGEMRPGALILFELDAARRREPEAQTIFMAQSWSHCPAGRWTEALLRAVWERACSHEEPASAASPHPVPA